MDKNSVAGSTNEVKGAAKAAIGRTVGDPRLLAAATETKIVSRITIMPAA
jgi:uncharacterized protein YjbJ (UPF0337 family)